MVDLLNWFAFQFLAIRLSDRPPTLIVKLRVHRCAAALLLPSNPLSGLHLLRFQPYCRLSSFILKPRLLASRLVLVHIGDTGLAVASIILNH